MDSLSGDLRASVNQNANINHRTVIDIRIMKIVPAIESEGLFAAANTKRAQHTEQDFSVFPDLQQNVVTAHHPTAHFATVTTPHGNPSSCKHPTSPAFGTEFKMGQQLPVGTHASPPGATLPVWKAPPATQGLLQTPRFAHRQEHPTIPPLVNARRHRKFDPEQVKLEAEIDELEARNEKVRQANHRLEHSMARARYAVAVAQQSEQIQCRDGSKDNSRATVIKDN